MFRLLGWLYHVAVFAILGSYLVLLLTNLRKLGRLEDEEPCSGDDVPHVSVLIPARNEAEALPRCVDSLLSQDYPRFDITVLDDDSTDGTRDVVCNRTVNDERLRLIEGKPLPAGWAGKSWACQQLGLQATGDVLLFVDADTWFEPDMLARAAGIMERENTGLLSVMPHQVTTTFAERLVIPGLYMSFLCGMPLWRIEDQRFPNIAAANGQFMCFRATVYWDVDGHEAVKNEIVDDITFARVVKGAGFRVSTRTALRSVHCRMYRSWREVLDGFSKNAFSAVGERPVLAAGYIGIVFGAQVMPAALTLVNLRRGRRNFLWFWFPLAECALLVFQRWLVSRKMLFQQSDAFLAPLAGFAGIVIILRSMWWKFRGGYRWKGRRYQSASLPR